MYVHVLVNDGSGYPIGPITVVYCSCKYFITLFMHVHGGYGYPLSLGIYVSSGYEYLIKSGLSVHRGNHDPIRQKMTTPCGC